MKRQIISIDEEKCNGCGVCIPNCHEGALQIIDGKARLISELFCDGLGACIGHCPEGAISIIEREAAPYLDGAPANEKAIPESGCPGARAVTFSIDQEKVEAAGGKAVQEAKSELRQWPAQLHLLNPRASYFREADVLLAADCTAFSMGNFHSQYLKGRSLAIACPKLDSNKEAYVQKLTAMIADSDIRSLEVLMMEVPCCGGLLRMAEEARAQAGKHIPIRQTIVSITGEVLQEETL